MINTQLLYEENTVLSSNPPIRVIGSMEPEMKTKILRSLSENLGETLPASTLGYPIVKIAFPDDASSEY